MIESITINSGKESILKYLKSYLPSIQMQINNVNGFKIYAETGTSFRSWGEIITIDIRLDTNNCVVSIESKPVSQLLDWGKSKENIELIKSGLIRRFH